VEGLARDSTSNPTVNFCMSLSQARACHATLNVVNLDPVPCCRIAASWPFEEPEGSAAVSIIGLAEVKIQEDKTLRRGDMAPAKTVWTVRNISPRHLELSVPARRPATLVGNATSRRDARM
jgi:hypothetical protein